MSILILTALLGQTTPAPDASPLAPGIACPIRAPYKSWAPACPGEEVYRGLLKVVKGRQSAQLQILRDHGLKFLADGASIRILAIHDDRSLPLYAPTAEIETIDTAGKTIEGPFWVPVSYLRRPGEKPPPAEASYQSSI